MASFDESQLSRRERQIMEILFRNGSASAREVLEEMDDAPSYSAVRALLATMEDKGVVEHRKDGRRYVYQPKVAQETAKRSATQRLLETFFGGRAENLVASLLNPKEQKLTGDEIAKIRALIDEESESSK